MKLERLGSMISGTRCPVYIDGKLKYYTVQHDKEKGIGWEWQSIDGCMVKAPLAREAVGHNPTDRGKNGDKTKYSD